MTHKIALLGLWHLGAVYSACLADLGYLVVGWDADERRIHDLNAGNAPLFEPGLDDLISSNVASRNLSYTSNMREAIEGCSYIFITYDTPVDDNDEVDLADILAAIEEGARYLEDKSIVVVNSQVPIGTCDKLKAMIAQNRPDLEFDIACSPENLRLGCAIKDFKEPDRVVIGSNSAITLERVEELFSKINAPVIKMNLRTAEMTKHALNAFLATSVSFANEIGNICDRTGADALKVAEALRADSRIGRKALLRPGLGFAGATLARDMKILQHLSEKSGYAAPLINGVLKVNDDQNVGVVTRLETILKSLNGSNIGVLGLTYKPGTSTLRRSAAIEIIGYLAARGALIKCFDPKASREELEFHKELQLCDTPYEAAKGSDALVFITEWPEFSELDFGLIKSTMNVPPIILDAQNMLDAERMQGEGFTYLGTGRGNAKISSL